MVPSSNTIALKDGRLIGISEYGISTGSPIFYFHGFPGSRLEAERFHAVALMHQIRLIGLDRPGMGLSSKDKNRSILSWADDVAQIANYLKIEKFSLLGHSGGAAFVAACAYAIPERINAAAIVSGMAPFTKPEAKIGIPKVQKIINTAILVVPGLATAMMQLTLMMFKKPNKMLDQMLKKLPSADQNIFHDPNKRQSIITSTREAFKSGVTGAAQELKLLLKPWGFNLEEIKLPVKIWYGTLDAQVPRSHATIYANLIPQVQLYVLENEGHHSLIINHIEDILKGIIML